MTFCSAASMNFLLCEQSAVRYTHVSAQLRDTELLWQFIRWYSSYIRCQRAVRDTSRPQSARFLYIATVVRRYVNFGIPQHHRLHIRRFYLPFQILASNTLKKATSLSPPSDVTAEDLPCNSCTTSSVLEVTLRSTAQFLTAAHIFYWV